MLDTLLCLDLGIDSGSRSSYGIVSLIIGTSTVKFTCSGSRIRRADIGGS